MRRIIASILALSALLGLLAVGAPAARADGDPASDVLASAQVFNPYDSGASAQQAARLAATVAAANRAGYPIRVALINSAADLGSVTQYWQNPSGYGVYLGSELKFLFRGAALVVMPQGYGFFLPVPNASDIPKADFRVMDAVVAPGSGLADGAAQTVATLARANGHPIAALGTIRVQTFAAGPSSPLPIIAFGLGLVAIIAVWGASLRARPLRRRVIA